MAPEHCPSNSSALYQTEIKLVIQINLRFPGSDRNEARPQGPENMIFFQIKLCTDL